MPELPKEIDDIEELALKCIRGSMGYSFNQAAGFRDMIQDRFDYDTFRAGLSEILDKIYSGDYEKERIDGILLENAKEKVKKI